MSAAPASVLSPADFTNAAAREILADVLRRTAAAYARTYATATRPSMVATQAEGMLSAALVLAVCPALRADLRALQEAAMLAAVSADHEERRDEWYRGYNACGAARVSA